MKLLIVGPADSGKAALADFLSRNGFSPAIEVSDRVGGAIDDGAQILKLEEFHAGVKDVPAPERIKKHSDLALFMKAYGARLLELAKGEAERLGPPEEQAILQFRDLLEKWR